MRPEVRLAALLSCVLALSAARAEPGWRDFDGVTNTSFVEAGGDRAIQLAIDVPAPPTQVFAAFATTEGFSSWAVPFARVDLRVGGTMETSYRFDAQPGDRDNIRNEIVAYVPDRLVVIRNVQAPRDFPDPELFRRTATAIVFDPIAGGTRVTVTHAGFGEGEGYDRLHAMFEWGDAATLAALRRRFVDGPVDWNARRAAAAKKKAD